MRPLVRIPPLMGALLVVWVIVSAVGGMVIGLLITEGSSVRDRRRWQQEQAQRRQLWDMEQQIREEEHVRGVAAVAPAVSPAPGGDHA